jgi:hypothetical protein
MEFLGLGREHYGFLDKDVRWVSQARTNRERSIIRELILYIIIIFLRTLYITLTYFKNKIILMIIF